jgi:excisionase family DNA binding protein
MKETEQSVTEGREYISVKEFIRLTGLSQTSAYRLLEQGELPFVRVGRRTIRIPVDAWRAYTALNSGAPAR